MKSENYNAPSCESSIGNVTADVMSYTLTGAEAADTTVLMRRMSERNTYLRITAISEAAMIGILDIGYVSREVGQADDLGFFKAAVDMATANQAVIPDVAAVGLKHDLALTIKTNNAGNAGKSVKLLVEFINTSG